MNDPGGIFVTGTDTGVGKTVVSAVVLAVLRAGGCDAVPMKPVQTGATWRGGRWQAPDLRFLLAASGCEPDCPGATRMAPYCYGPAVSPHLAAARARRPIRLDRIADCWAWLRARHGFIVAEGAGGILAPLGRRETMLDLMKALDVPVLLVARPGLGTLNHTLLSLRELARAGLRVAGVVFCAARPGPEPLAASNGAAITRWTGVPLLATVPHRAGLNTAHRLPANFAPWACRVLPPAPRLRRAIRTARLPAIRGR